MQHFHGSLSPHVKYLLLLHTCGKDALQALNRSQMSSNVVHLDFCSANSNSMHCRSLLQLPVAGMTCWLDICARVTATPAICMVLHIKDASSSMSFWAMSACSLSICTMLHTTAIANHVHEVHCRLSRSDRALRTTRRVKSGVWNGMQEAAHQVCWGAMMCSNDKMCCC